MEHVYEDLFAVFLRRDGSCGQRPDLTERPLATCSSYAEARRIQSALRQAARDCIIRYVGPAGGGD
jgi:hypothetical protein